MGNKMLGLFKKRLTKKNLYITMATTWASTKSKEHMGVWFHVITSAVRCVCVCVSENGEIE